MSVSLNSFAQFLNFSLKIKKQKVLPHWYMQWRRWIGRCVIEYIYIYIYIAHKVPYYSAQNLFLLPSSLCNRIKNTWVDPEVGMGSRTPPGKSQVAIGFLWNTGTDHPREAIGPLGSNCHSREVCTGLCVPKILMTKKNVVMTLSWRNFLDPPMRIGRNQR